MGRLSRFLSALVVLCLIAVLVPVSIGGASNGVTVAIVAPAQVAPGSDFVARVTITEVTLFDSAQFDVWYDPGVIQVLVGLEGNSDGVTHGVIDSTEIPIDMWGYVPQGTPGRMRIICNLPGTTGVSGSGYLADIHFHVVGAPGTSSVLHFSDGLLSNNVAQKIEPVTWVDGSVEVVSSGTLNGTVALQGRPLPPNPRWAIPVAGGLFEPGTSNLLGRYNTTTDESGQFSVPGITPGTYDIGVKGWLTVSRLAPGLVIVPGDNSHDFGTLLAGDANDDDYIGGADYSLLFTYYGQSTPEALQHCDFNNDGYVGGADYSLLYTNFGAVGEMPIWPLPP